MSTSVNCDHCGAAITEVEDRVLLSVEQPGWLAGQLPKIRSGAPMPERIDIRLDLHLACYLNTYRPVFEQR